MRAIHTLGGAVEEVGAVLDVLERAGVVWDLVVRVCGGRIPDEDARDVVGELLSDLWVRREQRRGGRIADKDYATKIVHVCHERIESIETELETHRTSAEGTSGTASAGCSASPPGSGSGPSS